jgi:hypothetical protein
MSEAVAAVRFDISAETAKLQEGVRKANAILAQLRGQATGIEAAFSRLGSMLAGVFAVSSITTFIGHAVEAGAKVDDLAAQAGLTTVEFQELAFALRKAGVEQEAMSAAFAVFGRNLSDLNRGTGSLLDFTRRFAPALGEQLRGVRDTSEAFRILVSFLGTLTDRTDQLRVAQVALGRQGSRLAVEAASIGDGLNAARLAAHRANVVFSEEQAAALETAQQSWRDLGNAITVTTGKIIAALVTMGTRPRVVDAEGLQAQIDMLTQVRDRAGLAGQSVQRLDRDIARLRLRLEESRHAADNFLGQMGQPAPPPPSGIEDTDRIKAAQAALQLLQSRLQAIPPAAFQMSAAFRQALGASIAVINLTADVEQRGAMATAAANQMRLQAYQAYTAALGASLPLQEQHAMRVAQINLAIQDQAMRQLALNQANLDYQTGLMNLATQMGAVVTPMEAYRLKLEQIAQTIRANPELAGRMAGANTRAAATMVAAYAGAANDIAGNLSQMFQKNKGLSAAAAIISGLAGAARAIEIYGPTPWGWAAAASAAALGVANAAKIMSQSESGTGAPSSGGGQAPPEAPQMSTSQAFTISVAPGRYSHDEVMQIIADINDRVQNGATLISTQVR